MGLIEPPVASGERQAASGEECGARETVWAGLGAEDEAQFFVSGSLTLRSWANIRRHTTLRSGRTLAIAWFACVAANGFATGDSTGEQPPDTLGSSGGAANG